MAARRLLIIMVVLLAISTLAAALVPPPEQRDGTTASTTSPATTTTPKRPAGGDLVKAEVSVGRASNAPERIEVSLGDQLALTVTSTQPGEVSVPDFGLIEFAAPGNPARFDILIEENGDHPVRFRGGATVATIVAEPKRSQS